MRLFYLTHREIIQTPSELFDPSGKIQTLSEQSLTGQLFPLSWSHYVRLLSVKTDQARRFYEQEALRGGWSVRAVGSADSDPVLWAGQKIGKETLLPAACRRRA